MMVPAVLAGCGSTKHTTTNATEAETMTATRQVESERRSDLSLSSRLAIELDSLDMWIEPMQAHENGADSLTDVATTGIAPAYRVHIKANRAQVASRSEAASSLEDSVSMEDSTLMSRNGSVQTAEESESTGMAKPPDLTMVILILGCVIAIIFIIKK